MRKILYAMIVPMIGTFFSGSAKADFQINLNSNNPVTPGISLVGQINWTRVGTSTEAAWIPKNFGTFCIEENAYVYIGSTYNARLASLEAGPSSGAMGTDKADSIRRLWAQFHAGLFQDDPLSMANHHTADEKARAFQKAIWDIEAGSVVFSDSDGLAQQYFDYATKDTDGKAKASLVALILTNPSNGAEAQDQIIETPVPASVILAFAGFLPMLGIFRFWN